MKRFSTLLSIFCAAIVFSPVGYSEFVSVCDRTTEVRDAIVAAVPGKNACGDVTAEDLLKITSIDLQSQNITALKAVDFNGLTNLTKLSLGNNDLSSLPADIFDGLTELEKLYLYSNDLSSLDKDIFEDLTALKYLTLSGNDLSSLPADIFDDLTKLEELYLPDNDLSSLDENIFDGLTELTHLYLYDNDLSSLDENIFDGLAKLKKLPLSYNKLNSLDEDIFDGLTALKILDLGKNDLSSLDENIFDEPTALTRLTLNYNKLSSLDEDIFDGLTALEELYLGNNDLSSLDEDIFDGLTALEILYLGNNELSSLPAGIFDGLTALKRFDLRDNTVDPIPLTVSLKREAGAGEFKATVDTGAPPSVTLTVSVVNGSIVGGSNSIPILAGKIESETFTVERTDGTTAAVTVDIETLPRAAPGFLGYKYVKSTDDLPLTVIDAVGGGAPRRIPADAVPSETVLSANYPNPFNPETWIPYQLSNTSDVKITIYDMRGTVVRRLDLGHQRAGYYTSRSRAAYWDGRNNRGERVASGIYFYQLQADHISLLRKMVILQ